LSVGQDTKTHWDRILKPHVSPYSRHPLLMWPLPELVSQASATGPMSQHIHGVLDTLSSQSCDTSRPEETVPSGAFDRCSDGDADQIHVGSSMTCDRSGSRETLPHDSNQRAFRCSPDPCIWANAPESVQYTPVLCRSNPVNPLLYTTEVCLTM
jgi:hypothetical protein